MNCLISGRSPLSNLIHFDASAPTALIYGQKRDNPSNFAAYSATNMLPCFSSRNSIFFLLLTSVGKYFIKNSSLNISQVMTIPPTSILRLSFIHLNSASSANIWVASLTFWSSVVTIALKILSIPWSQVWEPSGFPWRLEGGSA